MRWKIIFFTILLAAILCNYKVCSIDEVEQINVASNNNNNKNDNNEQVEQVPDTGVDSNYPDKSAGDDSSDQGVPVLVPIPSSSSEVKNDNDDGEKDYEDVNDNDRESSIEAVESIPNAVSVVPRAASAGSIVVASNSSAMMSGAYRIADEYRWVDDGFLSPLDLNDLNYDWNGKFT